MNTPLFLSSLALAFTLACLITTSHADPADDRAKALKLQNDGNFNEALTLYQALLESPGTPDAAQDLAHAVDCLNQLARINEADALVENALALAPANPALLQAAADYYISTQHFGFLIAGEFSRGQHRGGGDQVDAFQRDRTRALQLMQQALDLEPASKDQFCLKFARMIRASHHGNDAWRLQLLTDLASLPDYEEAGRYYYGGESKGGPVTADGKPLYYVIPSAWIASQNDGERWRWLLEEAARLNPAHRSRVDMEFANFLHEQFGVQTMANNSWFQRPTDDEKDATAGILTLHTLEENQTIARLATGIQRFRLPKEFNFIEIYQKVADTGHQSYAETALSQLSSIFSDRRQYPRAAQYWTRNIDTFGPGQNDYKKHALDQITGNWGRFDNTMTHPAGEEPSLGFVFRNGHKLQLSAHAIKVEELLADIKDYLKSNPRDFDHNQTRLGDIGYRLVYENEKKYLDKKVADWNLDLDPAADHWDRRIDIKPPLTDAGAYLIEAKMEDGNTSRIIAWLDDTIIVNKPLRNGTYYFVADAVTGKPIPKANVEFFGYDIEYLNRNKAIQLRKTNITTSQFAEYTDPNGQIILPWNENHNQFEWMVTARDDAGRLAFLGFNRLWSNPNVEFPGYDSEKTFVMTDRPVYRPDQKVDIKAWVRHVSYDEKFQDSRYAGQTFILRVHDAKNEKILDQKVKADAYGGFETTLELKDDAALGVYSITIHPDPNHHQIGSGTFRVEEYKKPEYEVVIKAPDEPVMLGDEITATIEANYFFGAPVTEATVKYKVLRTNHDAQWFPVRPWDWFYGSGYWWFAPDYDWWPGWRSWGCGAPYPWWFHRQQAPPEVVLENEVPIGEDGRLEIQVDTAIARELHPDSDHKYEITAEVVDASRRTIFGTGQVLVARTPFKVNTWVNRGYYRVGDTIDAHFRALTLDQKGVPGSGELTLFKVTYDGGRKPKESPVQTWNLDTNAEGEATQRLTASEKGQYRLSYQLTDKAGHTQEGGYVFVIRGDDFDGSQFRFNDLELTVEKAEYSPGDTVRLMINTDRADSTVALFIKPAGSVYEPPKILRLKGKSTVFDVAVAHKDMPNFFLEAFTVSDGKVVDTVREVVVPPEKRILNVEVLPSEEKYLPGEKATVQVKLTDLNGEPFVGSTVLTVYDKALEYISGGSNVPEIRDFFWKWRRQHQPATRDSVSLWFTNQLRNKEIGMGSLGAFGNSAADQSSPLLAASTPTRAGNASYSGRAGIDAMAESLSLDGFAMAKMAPAAAVALEDAAPAPPSGGTAPLVQPTIRSNFADTAFWTASLETDKQGLAEIQLDMPENLTTWKIKTWAMGQGTRVGQGETEVITSKNLIIRLQAPRFFVETDEVVLSANVHNYLANAKDVQVALELEGHALDPLNPDKLTQSVRIDADGEARIDWRVRATHEGQALVRMKALTDEESDGMEMSFPVFVHGILKTESWSGAIRPQDTEAAITLRVPEERRPEQTRLELRYSPSIAAAMVDALPYLASYPYGCTEQTLNRFLPTVITQRLLIETGIDLADIKKKKTNLNPQQIGNGKKRAQDWQHSDWNPVFDEDEVRAMTKEGVNRLTAMQNRDGGWGWFSGFGETSYPHTTAQVVRGLLIARENDVAIVPGVIEQGVAWLNAYQQDQVRRLKNHPKKKNPGKPFADNLDALVALVLAQAGDSNKDMLDFLYRDRTHLSVYAKAMTGITFDRIGDTERRDMIIRNISQFVVEDDENQTAYLKLDNGSYWWHWYGSEFEAHAFYLKLLSRTDPKNTVASGIVKYLLNNRRHATHWNSTRDTALCIEAIADYYRASEENKVDLELDILVDGEKKRTVAITNQNLFTFNNRLVLRGDDLSSGNHEVTFRKRGDSPLYFNAYLENFTLEDFIEKAGLEIKIERHYYKIVARDKKQAVPGGRGQAVEQKVEAETRIPLKLGDELVSGDTIEVEFAVESKNDYEYIIVEDWKPAGCEAEEVRSGYIDNGLRAYLELRDEKAAFFLQSLPRGKHSFNYRLRAEIPGKFSALPTQAEAMYAPELKANADEFKLGIQDRP